MCWVTQGSLQPARLGMAKGNVSLAKLRAAALCTFRTVGREEVVSSALGGSLCLSWPARLDPVDLTDTLQAKWAKIQ